MVKRARIRPGLIALAVFLASAPALYAQTGVPHNVTASSSGSTVTIRWEPPIFGGTVTGYMIEAGSSIGLADLANFNTGTTASVFSASGVGPGTYYVRVRAVRDSGVSSPSNEAVLIIGGNGPCSAAPGPPGAFTLVTNSGGTIGFTWTPASGLPATYIIEAGSASGLSNLASSDLGSTGTSFTTSGVGNGTYFVRLRARNACGTSGASSEVVLTVGSTTPVPGVGARFNLACSTQGALGLSGGYLICDGGKWRYATYADAPVPPRSGYTTRPSWYPTLATMLGSKMACPSGGVSLTYSPLPVDQLTPFAPYGAMIFDHVTPIDHAYLSIKSLDKPVSSRTEGDYVPVTAAADGVIIELSSLGSPASNRVVIDHGCGIYTVTMVLNRPAGVLAAYAARVQGGEFLRLEIPITAGAEFGRQRDNPLDFNVFDQSAWLPGFANVFSYAAEAWKPYTVSPTPYFTPTLGSLFESLSQRSAAPRWGKIDDDLAGTAQGSWFLDGTLGYSCVLVQTAVTTTVEIQGGPIPGKNSYSYCHLALSPHWLQPNQPVASLGWWADPAGDFVQLAISARSGPPAPAQLTAVSGAAVYELVPISPGGTAGTTVVGVLAVRVNADDTLTVEMLPGATSAASFGGFTANQRKYHR